MPVRVGTSGFSYKEWKGGFYPEKLPARQMLGYYAEHLGAVEVNNTFYRMPRASVLEGWAQQVPTHFRFAIKASRRITHHKRLVGAEEELAYLLSQLEALGERLGVVLFQLPPNLRADLDRLSAFLDLLPEGLACAFEFRHPSWLEGEAPSRLRERGAALCIADTDEAPAPALDLAADLAYLRLRRAGYDDAELAEWALRLRSLAAREIFVFFKHEVLGPRLAESLQARVDAAGPASVRPAAAEELEVG